MFFAAGEVRLPSRLVRVGRIDVWNADWSVPEVVSLPNVCFLTLLGVDVEGGWCLGLFVSGPQATVT